jgi:hypothetical protein
MVLIDAQRGAGVKGQGDAHKKIVEKLIDNTNTAIKLKIVYLPFDFVQKAVVKQIFGGSPPPGFSTVCICDGIKCSSFKVHRFSDQR